MPWLCFQQQMEKNNFSQLHFTDITQNHRGFSEVCRGFYTNYIECEKENRSNNTQQIIDIGKHISKEFQLKYKMFEVKTISGMVHYNYNTALHTVKLEDP